MICLTNKNERKKLLRNIHFAKERDATSRTSILTWSIFLRQVVIESTTMSDIASEYQLYERNRSLIFQRFDLKRFVRRLIEWAFEKNAECQLTCKRPTRRRSALFRDLLPSSDMWRTTTSNWLRSERDANSSKRCVNTLTGYRGERNDDKQRQKETRHRCVIQFSSWQHDAVNFIHTHRVDTHSSGLGRTH